jgi:hypothetical protein
MILPTWIVGPLMKLTDLIPKRPKLAMEIRQVCFDRVLASLTPDFSDYTFDLYLFLEVWVVNRKETPTTIKDWKLTVFGNGQKVKTEHLPDFSKWHQHIKVKEKLHGLHVIRDIRNGLDPFPATPLQHGIAAVALQGRDGESRNAFVAINGWQRGVDSNSPKIRCPSPTGRVPTDHKCVQDHSAEASPRFGASNAYLRLRSWRTH